MTQREATSYVRVRRVSLFCAPAGSLAACAGPPPEPVQRIAAALYQADDWAFLWNQSASAALNTPYFADASYAAKSSGDPASLYRGATGAYVVRLPGFRGDANTGGVPHVVAYGSDPTHCAITKNFPQNGVYEVDVNCYDSAGNPADTKFVLTYQFRNRGTTIGPFYGAYFWNNNKDAAGVTTPDAGHAWTSTGGAMTSNRTGTGTYLVTLGGMAAGEGGNLQVTAYLTNGWCKTAGWGPVGNDVTISVNCYNGSGAPANQYYFLTFSNLSPEGGNSDGYAFGNDATSTALYSPFGDHRRIQINGSVRTDSITAKNLGDATHPGRYLINYPGLIGSNASAAMVTGFGNDEATCKIESWSGSALVIIRCYRGSALFNSRWSSAYVTNQLQ
jgi:hypothetical protein